MLAWLRSNRRLFVFSIMATAFLLAMYELDESDIANKKEFMGQKPARQHAAEAWMVRNGIDGHAACYADTPRCDVVPKDTRAPFKITCRAEDGVCGLE